MLTVKQIDAARPAEKPYRLADAGGLFLYVPPSGKKVWRMRYRFGGKEKTLVIGPYPEISLTEARAKQSEAKMKMLAGVDPAEQKQAIKKKEKEELADTFGDIFREWHTHKSKVWSKGYADEMMSMFTDDILPIIGHLKMDDVEPMVLLKVIRLFEDRGAMERADKARRRCGEVFSYAIVTGRAKYNPSRDLSGAMRGYRKKNYPFLPMHRIHEFQGALNAYGGWIVTKIATQILHYTAMRTIELRSLVWTGIDYENRLISVDPEVMKGRKLHVIPMSEQVIELFRFLQNITGLYELCFPGRNDRKKPISENAILGVIRNIGYEGQTSGHGFRHQFSTVLNEKHWNSDAIEMQLAHVSGGTRSVYNHAAYLDTRREMMQFWADWLDEKTQ
ncbi:TPA: tyrosine-type recombinase/integrase [Klebsiella pneumoniae]|uniref:tyrosine-type recombinase/integrase n=1 Tax=Klebsiella pneumoniae TaxID=573 RepID=UPI00080CAA3F|nr:integrase arm-type DNA-binding domain-containing protein [Klebsiella pneumoniae]MBZ2001698.1 tyrosine-type recombinase/integrase [Klebsiella pneumoniae]MCP6350967.1 tyrosine-type recombinase/integrase [Klebsiella pneumoniae]MCQ0736261.1 tyrosine-type recombinase/integrase [Klebsiella pneumoniae]MDD1875989.1 tyrosine-type recombinase/integrase [Klebsiella pneumoniae]MDX8058122.1 tyrosine-type recombinase/integrase [Klebsiella pneumoniae]